MFCFHLLQFLRCEVAALQDAGQMGQLRVLTLAALESYIWIKVTLLVLVLRVAAASCRCRVVWLPPFTMLVSRSSCAGVLPV